MRVSPALGMCAVRWSSRAIALKGQGARLQSLRRIAELFEREREASDFAKKDLSMKMIADIISKNEVTD